ncbi:MAG: agarase [Bacteroidota bacterium]
MTVKTTVCEKILLIFILLFAGSLTTSAQDEITVKAKKKVYHEDGTRSYGEWNEYPTQILHNLSGFSPRTEPAYSQFGGRLDTKVEATGFFYPKKVGDRWWLVDPEGHLFIHKAVVTVKPGTSEKQNSILFKRFGSNRKWLDSTSQLLTEIGFNGTGNWSDADLIKESPNHLIYTRGFNFMAGYGKKRGGTFQQPGHTGYPNDLIFVFDPEFEQYCDTEAAEAMNYKNEKSLLGYFSDNEMPFPNDALDRYLKLGEKDPGYRAAKEWLSAKQIAVSAISDAERNAFLAYMSGRYFSIVSKAIKKYDPNHLYLGCRFHGDIIKKRPVFESAGKFMDAVSVNYYDVWTPENDRLVKWSEWSGKPILITEWYTKAEDSGLKNQTGAGWIVPTQKDRGYFYQNFTLALLESKVVVGWHWFKYQDNDPTDKKADPSNADANKGIVDNNFTPYYPLLEEMKEVNTNVYGIIDYFDAKKTQ